MSSMLPLKFSAPDDYCKEATPVPIPNTVVKLLSADDTRFSWESRSLSGLCPVYQK